LGGSNLRTFKKKQGVTSKIKMKKNKRKKNQTGVKVKPGRVLKIKPTPRAKQ